MEERRKRIQKKKAKEKKMRRKELLMTSILNPLLLFIGTWKFEGNNEKDELVVKLNFVRRQMCYEVMWNGSRKKIEVDWSHIMGIRASLNDKGPGILEVELSHPPNLYEILNNNNNVESHRRHKKWVVGWDFTQGQAPVCRGHFIVFPPGMLDKHFRRLISFDKRLFELSRKSFPSNEMPFFYEQQPNIVYRPNQFTMTTSNNQILQLPHRLPQHLTQFTVKPSGCVRLPPSSLLFRPNIRTSARMNKNYFHWRPIPEEIVDNGNSSIIGRGLLMVSEMNGYRTWHNVDLIMSRSSSSNNNNNNNNPPDRPSQHYSIEASSTRYNSSNRVRRPSP